MLRLSKITCFAVAILLSSTMAAQSTASQTAGDFLIAGTVVSATGGHPLARAQVTITDTNDRQNTRSAIASDEGRFEFHVGPGKYSLEAAKRGFITAAYDQHDQFSTAIVTGVGLDTSTLVLRIAPAAVLAGKVIDEAGDPVRQATMTLYREGRRTGVGRIRPFRRETTNDQGAFEFAPLDGATYFISVSAKPWYAVHPLTPQPGSPAAVVDPSLDVAYPITYYGDATEADDATPIPLRGGDHLDIDIHVTPVPALHLLFHSPAGENAFAWPVLQKPAFDGMNVIQADGMQQLSPGTFEINGVPPGRYNVRNPGMDGAQAMAAGEVDLTSDGQELSMPAEEAPSSVKLTVRLPGGAPLPSQLQLALRNARGRVAAASPINEKGEAEFSDLAPGKYEVIAGSPDKAYSIARIVSQGSETAGHDLVVPAGASLSVTLSLLAGEVTIEGFAKRDGKPLGGAMIVLVPKDPQANHELFRRDQSDLDGSFSLRSVIPGSYTLLAIEDGWDLDWAKPAVIEHYSAHGQSVVVKQASGTVRVSDAVAVQMK